MGFMDKLKSAGKGVLNGALALASTTYGTVSSGKYDGCKIGGLGTDRDSLTFVKGTQVEEKLLVIADNIKTFTVKMDDDVREFYSISLIYTDGETSLVKVNVEQNKNTVAEKYSNASSLVAALALHVQVDPDDTTKHWVNKIMRLASLPDIYFR